MKEWMEMYPADALRAAASWGYEQAVLEQLQADSALAPKYQGSNYSQGYASSVLRYWQP